jgi:hypothetical protein
MAYAQSKGTGYVGKGYYRVRNLTTERYIYVTDNKDYYDIAHDKEDFQGIQLWKDAAKAAKSPASVIFIEELYPGGFDLKAQGTGVYDLTGYCVNVTKKSDGTYEVSASRSGVTKFLSDDRTNSSDQGKLGTSGTAKYRRWIVDKIEATHATNYVGISPTITFNGKYYQTFYASFPFRTISPGMRVYYISDVEGDLALIQEIEGDVPAATPVIIECASANATDNRIEPLPTTTARVTDNLLCGVYFCNGKRPQESVDAYTKFDAATMRILTVADGKLVMSDNAPERLQEIMVNDYTLYEQVPAICIPANTCYFKANANTPKQVFLTSDPTAVDSLPSEKTDGGKPCGVYSLDGTQLRTTNNAEGLPAGIYIIGGKKVVRR